MRIKLILSIVCIGFYACGTQEKKPASGNSCTEQQNRQEANPQKAFWDQLHETHKIIHASNCGLYVLNTFANVWSEAQPYLAPNENQRLSFECIQRRIKILKIERYFKQCLVDNAFDTKENDLPCACTSLTKSYLRVAGIEQMEQMRSEFREIIRLLNEQKKIEQRYSTKTKVLIGLGVTTVVIGGSVVLIPILFPGSLLAVKITAGMAYLKAAALSAAPAATAPSTTIPTSAAGAAAICAAGSSNQTNESALANQAQPLSFAQKVDAAVRVMEYSQIATEKAVKYGLPVGKQIRPFIYELPEEELARLQATRTSLRHMLFETYGAKKDI